MEFLEQLKALGLYKPEMDVLDIGCAEGWLFFKLIELKPGRRYDAVDIRDRLYDKIDRSRVRFFQESFVNFVPDKKYDLIFARNVFFQEPGQIQQALRYSQYLKDDGVMVASFLGVDDPWADTVFDGIDYYSVTDEELVEFKKQVHVLWESENPKFRNTIRNNTEKEWHMYRLIFKKK
jgi:SAM-dependent methyltransferase